METIIAKIKEWEKIGNNKELAVLFKLSPADFSNRKKRGTLLPIILEWAINENVNLNWLFKKNETIKNQTVNKIIEIIEVIPEEKQKEVLKYAEERKLLTELEK